MVINSLDHVNIHTSNYKASMRFYTELLGFREGFRPPFDFQGAWLYAGEKPLVHLVVRDGVKTGVENPLDHVAFKATGYVETLDRLKGVNWKFSYAEVPDSFIRQIFLNDPNGVKIELNFVD